MDRANARIGERKYFELTRRQGVVGQHCNLGDEPDGLEDSQPYALPSNVIKCSHCKNPIRYNPRGIARLKLVSKVALTPHTHGTPYQSDEWRDSLTALARREE